MRPRGGAQSGDGAGKMVAGNQLASGGRTSKVMGIEDPAAAARRAAAGASRHALREAATRTQVPVTSQDADSPDDPEIPTPSLPGRLAPRRASFPAKASTSA